MRAFARPFNSWDVIKLIALLLMFVDHAGWFFLHDQHWLRAIGRGAAPIFLFLGGFAASYRFNRQLLVLAVLMTISDTLMVGHPRPQNILFSILLCRALFHWLDTHGRKIERPYEWYIGSVAFLSSIFVIQYGTLGLLFGISGYLKRHPQYYSPSLAQRFLLLTFGTYAGVMVVTFSFAPIDVVIMAMTLLIIWRWLSRLEIHDVHPPGCPLWLLRTGKMLSFYTGYIYAFHLIVLEWITRIPF